MKKIVAILCFCLLGLSLYAGSDSTSNVQTYSKHNIRVGLGILPDVYFKNRNNEDLDNTVGQKDKLTLSTSFYLNYMYAPATWLEWGVYASYATRKDIGRIYSDGKRDETIRDQMIVVMPALRANWLRKEWVSMYSSAAVGASFHWSYAEAEGATTSQFKVRPTIQVLLIGLTVGKRLYGFVDVYGFGSLGLFSAGAGYKF